MVTADAWSTVGSLAAVVAALAALVTVWFARRTVMEARAGRREQHDAHTAEIHQQERLLNATVTAHEREMQERDRALAAELVLQRIAHLRGITNTLRQLSDLARDDIEYEPSTIPFTPIRLTRITGAIVHLRALLAMFESLGGPPLMQAQNLVNTYSAGTPPGQVLGMAMNEAFTEAISLAENHESLKLPSTSS
jgi:hypothetical protein